MYIRGMIQMYNLILEYRLKTITKEIRQQLYSNINDRSKSVSNGLSPSDSYSGSKSRQINRTIMNEKIGLDDSLTDNINLAINKSKFSIGTLPTINRSRQNDLDSNKH